jgi:glyoxylase-like metal-dependent hydrolase (beta-lactamase superfamily II)
LPLEFEMEFEARYGEAVSVAPNVHRITAPNGGPFTFHGTNSYLIGTKTLALIDPGPDDEAHLTALLNAIGGRKLSHIFVTHTHRDHSPLTAKLVAATGAKTYGYGPHVAARELGTGETNFLDSSADYNFMPDFLMKQGDIVVGDGWAIEGVFTPGHTANHLAFALCHTGILFSGDHVMAWATSIVAPPDGSMDAYMKSLDVLITRDDRLYFPGHGGPVRNPDQYVRALRSHRLLRENAILSRLKKGDRTISEIVKVIYRRTDPRLHGAAALSVFAHLERLIERKLVKTGESPSLVGVYEPT